MGKQGLGGKGTSPAAAAELLPALPAPPATAVQPWSALAGEKDQPALVHQNAAEADLSHVSGTCMIVWVEI